MRVTKPLVYERKEGFVPRIAERHEILTGVNAFPPITGFVMTELKHSPLVEVGLRSPVPDDGANATLLATWQFGLGRVLAITTDAGQRWAADWKGWQHYDSFYERAIRWTMRPDDSRGNFYWNAEFRNGRLQAVVTALNDGEVYLNFLDLNCVVTTPELELMEMPMHQVAPGRYEGALVLDQPGAYQMAIDLGEGRGVLRAGAIAPAGAEFRDQGANVGLLRSLALQRPTGGEPGALVHADQVFASSVGSIAGDGLDTFRPTLASATDFDDAWPQLLLLAAVLFFLDIFVRRVVFDPLEAFAPLNQRLFGRDEATALPDERMERLLRQKEAAAQQGQRHAFELESHRPVEATPDAHPGEASTGTLPPTRPQAAPADAAGGDDSYTSRLFEAKRRARSDRGKQG